MAINWGMIQGQSGLNANQGQGQNSGQQTGMNTPRQGIIAQGQIPQQQDSEGDSGGGLGSLLKGFQGQSGVGQPGGNTISQALGQQAPGGLQGALQQQTQVGQGNNSIMQNAQAELGLGADSPTLKSYLQKANPNLDPTVTPWCAGFVGSVLNASGMKGTGSLAAKSYLNFGTPTNQPQQGDIAVFNDLTGRNDPAHGHVAFVQSVDQKSGMVQVIGGNQSGHVSVQQYPLSSVAGFRTPPSGQQVKQQAQQMGIQNPQQLAGLPNQINQQSQNQQPPNGLQQTLNPTQSQQPNQQLAQNSQSDSMTQSQQLLKNFEGYQSKPTWDVNAYRTGYGSDTITHPDGSVSKVQPGMSVTPEDANRDLQRRTSIFQQQTAHQVGGTWSKLPSNAQAALTSMAYNYGHLPSNVNKAAQTGDLNKISDAIRSHTGDNNGENAGRRRQEANYVLNGQKQSLNGDEGENNPKTTGKWPSTQQPITKPLVPGQRNPGSPNNPIKLASDLNFTEPTVGVGKDSQFQDYNNITPNSTSPYFIPDNPNEPAGDGTSYYPESIEKTFNPKPTNDSMPVIQDGPGSVFGDGNNLQPNPSSQTDSGRDMTQQPQDYWDNLFSG